jgi:hypothetical protein
LAPKLQKRRKFFSLKIFPAYFFRRLETAAKSKKTTTNGFCFFESSGCFSGGNVFVGSRPPITFAGNI